ncbi:Mrp/NBP35 family ATP-binding protein [Novosphingobium album (ex Liu et al. 2023)]|uniref:Iron-sulfur cluster carrier protein n=1 Tax=Novosphingobium album (ex Liu et al. 2023) TaxID=3031130 RepID=A0ABT5WLI2_9SPHN|nr:Mrp/NBP35 family ATP-binding protein [Novosphingobium album (ex Liu et al. 2023)]MDE8650905.1 Mrp/NBP35 family ATP-binding protein [Novosphingobium album (ex Liu et al. 2023)]
MSSKEVDALKAKLPEAVATRLQSLRLADGRATLVVDATGLSALDRDKLEVAAKDALRGAPGIAETRVAMMADKVRRRIVAVGSGKGGVGKSTVAANIAVALARMGRKVGLVDADIYGPSQARLLGTEGIRPTARENKLNPVASPWGLPMLSMAQLADPGQAIAWRGPMAGNALAQLVEADWGDVEVLIVDLPPGTGDIQLTMLQRFKPAGAVIVSTPQDLALMDAMRAIELFAKGKVPVIGVVENMAGYVCPHCGEISDPFGSGGAQAAAKSAGLPFLGRIPLELAIRQDSDAGRPPAASDGAEGKPFLALAEAVANWLDRQDGAIT